MSFDLLLLFLFFLRLCAEGHRKNKQSARKTVSLFQRIPSHYILSSCFSVTASIIDNCHVSPDSSSLLFFCHRIQIIVKITPHTNAAIPTTTYTLTSPRSSTEPKPSGTSTIPNVETFCSNIPIPIKSIIFSAVRHEYFLRLYLFLFLSVLRRISCSHNSVFSFIHDFLSIFLSLFICFYLLKDKKLKILSLLFKFFSKNSKKISCSNRNSSK